jgi:hypothetical protein
MIMQTLVRGSALGESVLAARRMPVTYFRHFYFWCCVDRFNDLRKVRSKVKAAGTERPFSRMYNFYILEHGDKWARTGAPPKRAIHSQHE